MLGQVRSQNAYMVEMKLTISSLYNTFNHGLIDHSCGEFVSYAIDRLSDYPRVPIIVDNIYGNGTK